MAQDFLRRIQSCESDKAIALQDGEGMALAAIQGLHELLREKGTRP